MRRTEPGAEDQEQPHGASFEGMMKIRGEPGTHSLAMRYDASTHCKLTDLHDTTCESRSREGGAADLFDNYSANGRPARRSFV